MFTDVMIDIETTGTSPNRAAMIQLSAVKFNYETEQVCDEFFDRCLAIPYTRCWQEDTRHWWMQQKRHVLQGIFARMEPVEDVLDAFVGWLGVSGSDNGQWTMWAKPTHFEYPFIESYFRDYGRNNPLHYRNARDLNSFLSGMTRNPAPTNMDAKVPFVGDAHNALHDVLHQIKVLFEAKKQLACQAA